MYNFGLIILITGPICCFALFTYLFLKMESVLRNEGKIGIFSFLLPWRVFNLYSQKKKEKNYTDLPKYALQLLLASVILAFAGLLVMAFASA